MREVDRATDVLSFPEFDLRPGESARRGRTPTPALDWCLRDMVISMEHVAAQAKEYGHSNRRELAYLVVHSRLCICWAMTIWTKARRKSECGQERKLYWQNWGSPKGKSKQALPAESHGFAVRECPHFLFVLSKRKRARHSTKEKALAG